MKVVKHNFYFTIDIMGNESLRLSLNRVGDRLTQFDYANKVRGKPAIKAKWFLTIGNTYRYHINHFFLIQQMLKGQWGDIDAIATDESIKLSDYPTRKLKLAKGFKIRDYQSKAVSFLQEETTFDGKLLSLNTGRGKTLTAIYYAALYNMNVTCVMTASLLKQWREEVQVVNKYQDKDIVIITGAPKLRKLMKTVLAGATPPRVILLSLATYRSYMQGWLTGSDKWNYPVVPDRIGPLFQTGMLMIDEIHMQTLAHFNMLLTYKSVKMLGISATVCAIDRFRKEIQATIMPDNLRYDELLLNPYVDYVIYRYTFRRPERIQTSHRGRNSYSHVAVEKSMLRQLDILKSFIIMVLYVLDKVYLSRKRAGDKALIFFSMTETCRVMEAAIRIKYPQHSVIVLVGTMDKSEADGYDIIISTPSKVGTGTNIHGLISVIQTVSVDAVEQVIQTMGRLRPISGEVKDKPILQYMDDARRIFVQLICQDIRKQVVYGENRMTVVEPRVVSMRDYEHVESI